MTLRFDGKINFHDENYQKPRFSKISYLISNISKVKWHSYFTFWLKCRLIRIQRPASLGFGKWVISGVYKFSGFKTQKLVNSQRWKLNFSDFKSLNIFAILEWILIFYLISLILSKNLIVFKLRNKIDLVFDPTKREKEKHGAASEFWLRKKRKSRIN